VKKLGTIFLIILTLLTTHFFAYDGKNIVLSKIKRGIEFSKQFKDIDTVLDEEINKIILNEDGSYTEELSQISTILTQKGVEKLSYVLFFYNENYTKIELNYARIIRNNGEIVDVPYNFIGKAKAGKKNDGFFQFYIKFPELKIGDSIDYSIKLKIKPQIKNNFLDMFPFKYFSPILLKEVEIVVPEKMQIFFNWRNGNFKSIEKKLKDKKIFLFKVEKIPPLKTEEYMPSIFEISPTLYVSTIKNWEEISRIGFYQSEKCFDFSKEMEEKLKQLVKNKKNLEERVFSIYHYITNTIELNSYSFNTGAFIPPQKASVTFKKSHGICRDKSILLISFLRKLGLNPVECLTNFNYETFVKIPTLYFDHSIVMVNLNGKKIFLDPTSSPPTFKESTTIGGRYILPLTQKGSKIVKVPQIPPEKNQLEVISSSKYEVGNILKTSITISGKGIFDTLLRSLVKKVGSRNMPYFLNSLIKYIHPNSKMPIIPDYTSPDDYTSNEEILINIETKDYPIMVGKYLIFKPILTTGIFDPYFTPMVDKLSDMKKRNYPIHLISPFSIKYEEKFTLPNSNYKFITFPDDVKYENGPFHLSLKFNRKSKNLSYTFSASVSTDLIYPEEFNEFKEFCSKFIRMRKYIILVKLPVKEVKNDKE